MNFTIKSITDNAFGDNKESQLKEKALLQLFNNMNVGLSDSFRIWREVASIEGLINKINNQQKANLLKLLESLLSNDKVNRLREIVNKFRLNQRVNEIQRNFLKRLMMSRAGLVAVAFKTIQTLPRNLDIVKPNQFQQGLEKLVVNVLKKTFAAFRSDFE